MGYLQEFIQHRNFVQADILENISSGNDFNFVDIEEYEIVFLVIHQRLIPLLEYLANGGDMD